MSVQVAFSYNSSNMHFSLGLGLSLVCESGGRTVGREQCEHSSKLLHWCYTDMKELWVWYRI